MTATFTLTGDLVALVGDSGPRSMYVQLDRPVVDVAADVIYESASRVTVAGEFAVSGLPAKDAQNNGNAAFNIIVTIGKRKWLVPAQSAGSTHDLSEFTETTGYTPVSNENAALAQAAASAAAASAAAAAASAAALGIIGTGLALDTDGVPYFDPSLSNPSTLAVLADTDGTPYWVAI